MVKPTPRQDVQPSIAGTQAAQGCLTGNTHAANGTLFPQPWILRPAGRLRLDHLAGTGWRLVLAADAGDALRTGAQGLADDKLLTLVDLADPAWPEADQVVAVWMARHQCHAALVRPDHYVFGVASGAAELEALADDWAGHLLPAPTLQAA